MKGKTRGELLAAEVGEINGPGNCNLGFSVESIGGRDITPALIFHGLLLSLNPHLIRAA